MQAGEVAGGDKRGKQSAALVIYSQEAWADLDLRVDDHAEPLPDIEDPAFPTGKVTIVATHLEARTKPTGRVEQLEELLREIRDIPQQHIDFDAAPRGFLQAGGESGDFFDACALRLLHEPTRRVVLWRRVQ